MEIIVATTAAELDALTTYWDRLPTSSPHASRWLSTLVLETSQYGAQPHVTLIRDTGRDPILVVGRMERRPMPVKIGYRTLLSVPVRRLVVVAGGVVGARTPEDFDVVVRSLCASLRRARADILELSKVELDGPLHRAAYQRLAWYRRAHGSTTLKRHRSDLSRGLDAFLAARSKGTRWRLRRRLRRLDEATAGGEKLTVRQIGPGDGIAEAVRLLDGISARSYQRGIGVGFVDDELHRGLLSQAVSGGPYRAWVLFLDETPVAYLNGVLHERIFYLFETAFDATAAVEEPGGILMARVLQELAADPGVDGFDYGFGDAQYKQSLSDASWDEVDVIGFAARPRAMSLNAVTTAVAIAAATARKLLGGERVAALRRRRRAVLAPAATPGEGLS